MIAIIAIVPAAGGSGRMGRAKPLLDVGGRPMVMQIVGALLEGGVERVIVVANGEVEARLVAMPPDVSLARNDDRTSTMIDSVRIGLVAGADAGDATGYLVCPCDAAGITGADVRRCVEAFAEGPDRIVVATHGGRRGHPVIFPASLAAAIRSEECDGGLNRLARNRPGLVREVACESAGTVANVNTPADYEGLR